MLDRIKNVFFNKKALLITSLFWLAYYIIYVYHFKITFPWSDFGMYEYWAQSCADNGTMYPDYQFYNGQFVVAPGWVNILLVWYKIFGNFENVAFLELILMYLNLWLIFFIADKIFDKPSLKYYVIYIVMLIPAYGTAATTANTEVSYITLSSISFLLLFNKKISSYILAGILIALALWIRPIAEAWVLAALYYFLFISKRWKCFIPYLSAAVLTCLVIAVATHRNFPDYVYKSTTGGCNLIMAANDDATGGYCSTARAIGGPGYIPELYDSTKVLPYFDHLEDSSSVAYGFTNVWSYHQVDSIRMKRSVEWIKAHPVKYLSMTPRKVRILFDTTMDYIQHDHPNACIRGVNAFMSFLNRWIVRLLFLISVAGLFTPFWKERRIVYALIPIVVSSAITCVIVVMPRYNFVFLHLLIIFAVYSANALYPKIRNRVHSFINSHKA